VKTELDRLREKFDTNYSAWSPNLPYKERERLTLENREIFNKILELNQHPSHSQVTEEYSFGRFRR
jgi:hypothetical protein